MVIQIETPPMVINVGGGSGSALVSKGNWDASLNLPLLPIASSENQGDYYVVSASGTTNIDGITDWKVGDILFSNGTAWQKIDQSEAVSLSDLNNKSDINHNHTLLSLSEKSYNSLTDKPTIPTALSSLTKDINFDERYFTETEANNLLANKSDTTHNHSLNNLTEKSYNSLTDKPDLTSLHSHSNKSLLDTYTQTEVDIADAISKEHTHANKTDLDNYNPSSFATASHAHAVSDITSLQTTLNGKIESSLIGSANGIAGLGADGKVPTAQLPDAVLGGMNYQTGWNATTNTPTIPTATSTNKGYYYIVTTAGATSISGITDWKIGDWLVSNGTTWDKVDNTDSVTSVAGKTGNITLFMSDIQDLDLFDVLFGNIDTDGTKHNIDFKKTPLIFDFKEE